MKTIALLLSLSALGVIAPTAVAQTPAPSVHAYYMDTAGCARFMAVIKIVATCKPNVEAFVYDADADAYAFTITYLDSNGNKMSMTQVALSSYGAAVVAFFLPGDITLESTTATPLKVSGESISASQP